MKVSLHFRVDAQVKARLRERAEALHDEIGVSVDLSEYLRQRVNRIAECPRLYERAERLLEVCEAVLAKHPHGMEDLKSLVLKIKGEGK